jgi:hypothetical protein
MIVHFDTLGGVGAAALMTVLTTGGGVLADAVGGSGCFARAASILTCYAADWVFSAMSKNHSTLNLDGDQVSGIGPVQLVCGA